MPPASTSCSRGFGGRPATDRRSAGGQAGGAHVSRRGAAGPAYREHPRGGTHGHARSLRHRIAGGPGGARHPARAVRRGAAQDLPCHGQTGHRDRHRRCHRRSRGSSKGGEWPRSGDHSCGPPGVRGDPGAAPPRVLREARRRRAQLSARAPGQGGGSASRNGYRVPDRAGRLPCARCRLPRHGKPRHLSSGHCPGSRRAARTR